MIRRIVALTLLLPLLAGCPKDAGGFPNCAAVRSASAAPLTSNDPGWNPALDTDHDGVACE